ncbi:MULTISPECIES: transposase [Heyndrickxia]
MTDELVYDQDALLMVNENAGDLILTKEFQSYREARKLKVYFCRKADPESKGRIENVVGYVKGNFAKHRIFQNIDQWNESCISWLERTGNRKVHNTTKKGQLKCLHWKSNTSNRLSKKLLLQVLILV